MKIDEELEKALRKFAIDIYRGEHANKKANLWVCGNILLPNGAETKCHFCHKVCFYDKELKMNFTKNVKKVCPKCAYKLFLNDMSALEKDIIERMLEK